MSLNSTKPALASRKYRDADESSVLDLLGDALGSDPTGNQRTPEFWRWKHIANPFGRSFVRVSCNEDERIVGIRAFMQWKLRVGGDSIRAVRAVDTSTHSDYRRMGIFSNLTRQVVEDATNEGIDIIFNTPNQYSMPGYLKLGWQSVGAFTPMIKILNYRRFVIGLGRNRFGATTTQAYSEDDFFAKELPEARDILQEPSALRGLAPTENSDNGDGISDIATSKSEAYLWWRYALIPYPRYRILAQRSGGQNKAMAVIRTNTRYGLKEVKACELFLRDTNVETCKGLVKALTSYLNADYIIAISRKGSPMQYLLKKSGFRTVPRLGMNFTAMQLNPNLKFNPFQIENWALSLGDLELF